MQSIVLNLADVIKNRNLLAKLILKNLRVRYRYLYLGFLWAILEPLFIAFIFQVVFSLILRVKVEGYPFFIYLMTAIFPWRYFQESVSQATTSIVDNKNLLNELVFPYEYLPISIVLANLVTFVPVLAIMLLFLRLFRVDISALIFLLPAVVLLHTFFILGIVLAAGAVYVRFRDIKHIIEVLLVGLFYLTPVFYTLGTVAERFPRLLLGIYLLNPLVGILNLYRHCLLGDYGQTLPAEVSALNTLWLPLAVTIFVFLAGMYVFSRYKRSFCDYLPT